VIVVIIVIIVIKCKTTTTTTATATAAVRVSHSVQEALEEPLHGVEAGQHLLAILKQHNTGMNISQ